MIFYILQHLISSHLFVVCNGATVSMETTQMILNQYQTSHSQLVGNLITILSAKNY